MKNLSIKSTIATGVLSLAIVSVNANASCYNMKLYAGAGLDYNFYTLGTDAKNHLNSNAYSAKVDGLGLAPLLGVKFHRHVGVEAGFSFNKKLKLSKAATATGTFRMRNMYMDLVGFAPVNKHFDVLGGIGLGKMLVKSKQSVPASLEGVRNKFSWRAKLGVSYNFHPKVGLRGLVTYQNLSNKLPSLNNVKMFKHLAALNLALTYTF